jgi:folate-binding protein YgfZ
MLTVLGPRAAERTSELLGPGAPADLLSSLDDGDLLRVVNEAGVLVVARTAEVATPAFDLLGAAEAIGHAREGLARSGLEEVTRPTWDVLRVEAGTPEFGIDMDDTTIPVEAGIHTRVVDYQKGCFTGQEVLIRIRDRGHVNRSLRGLRFGAAPVPPSGAPLFSPNEERTVGHVTSAVRSPRFGEVIGLGYVRREVTPPAELRMSAPDGPVVRAESLAENWRPDPGSP